MILEGTTAIICLQKLLRSRAEGIFPGGCLCKPVTAGRGHRAFKLAGGRQRPRIFPGGCLCKPVTAGRGHRAFKLAGGRQRPPGG
jgi:hypothetical protein